MGYMEQQMQQYIEAGMQECEDMLEKLNPPEDWDVPEWGAGGKVHDWKNYASQDLINEWGGLNGRQHMIIASMLNDIAAREEWD